ncbi:glycoside hydrolase family 104 protein [Methylovulum psychrotolerans]|uniref:glycoside hydrolase family 24 protein n=1 Tax=Methylovulum psychrotolerans TaxID=1704499 RepID=UPI001BFF2BA9|nr:glycoside hydrolase family 104 protein [Methylovulum psychrotolerans]MBT9097456.1 glycoside hydrolase family 104 protein [Methylovulum psychrotolerans]
MSGNNIPVSPNLKNRAAFLTMVALSEGTEHLGDHGYNVLVGGTLFNGYKDHPRKVVHIHEDLNSTAAGRYQVLARFFDAYKAKLHLPDFGKQSQDHIALQILQEQHALGDVDSGKLDSAIDKCANIWASFPGKDNKYGQRTNSLVRLHSYFKQAGGVIA